jgi:hypothetical protein
VFEEIARVGIAGCVGESHGVWETPPAVLGTIGDELYLVEIDSNNRERILREIVDRYEGDDRTLRIEIALFGAAGGFFASALAFLESWPKSAADVPADVFIDHHHRAAFTAAGGDVVVNVRHALRRSDGPAKRQFRFRADEYDKAMSDLARESRCVRDELIAIAQRHAPDKVESLRAALERSHDPFSSLEASRRR